MSTPARTRVVTFQSPSRRSARPAPLPLSQRTAPGMVGSQAPSSTRYPPSATMTTTFSGPAHPSTPHPFSSLAAPITPAPDVEDPRSPKPQKHQETNFAGITRAKPPMLMMEESSLGVYPRTPFPRSAGAVETPRQMGSGFSALSPIGSHMGQPRSVNSPLVQAFWQPFSLASRDDSAVDASAPLSAIPLAMLGSKAGMIWSQASKTVEAESSIKSPTFVRTPKTANGGFVTSPAPRDPVSSFPTFAGVLRPMANI